MEDAAEPLPTPVEPSPMPIAEGETPTTATQAKPKDSYEDINPANIIDDGRKRKRGDGDYGLYDESKRTGTPGIEAQLRQPDFINREGRRMFNMLKNAKDILGRTFSNEFLKQPNREMFPDYYTTIRQPIAFEDIRNKLAKEEYTNLEQIERDFTRVFTNAKRYNMKGSGIFNDAKELHKKLRSHWAVLTGRAEEKDEDDDGPPVKKQRKDNKKETPSLKTWLQAKLSKVLQQADSTGRSYSEFFLELPNPEWYPDYYKIIGSPIAFDIIQKKIARKDYPTVDLFIADVNQIFANAKYYNEDGSRVWKDAATLERYFADLMRDPPPYFPAPTIMKREGSTGNKFTIKMPGTPTTPATSERLKLKFGAAGQVQSATAVIPELEPLEPVSRPPSPVAVSPPPMPPRSLPPAVSAVPRPVSAVPTHLLYNNQSHPASPLTPLHSASPTQIPLQTAAPAAAVAPIPPRRKTVKTVARLNLNQTPNIASFHIKFQPGPAASWEILSNSALRQHSIMVKSGVEEITIIAASTTAPLTPAHRSVVTSTAEEKEEAKVGLTVKAAGEDWRRVPKYSVNARPPMALAQNLPFSNENDGPNAIGKFTIRPTTPMSVLEIMASLDGEGPELYRLFFSKPA